MSHQIRFAGANGIRLTAYCSLSSLQLTNKRVSECEKQRDTNTDHCYRIEQCDDEEHFRLQHWSKLRLTCSAFKEATAQKAHADAYAERAETNQKCDGNRRKANNSFHLFLLRRTKSNLLNLKVKVINAILMPSSNTLWSAS